MDLIDCKSDVPQSYAPCFNWMYEIIYLRLFKLNELAVIFYIYRNTIGYSHNGKRQKWTRESTEVAMARRMHMDRSTLSSTLTNLINDSYVKKDGKKYCLNFELIYAKVLQFSTPINDQNGSVIKPRISHSNISHKLLQNETKHVENHNSGTPPNAEQAYIPEAPKEKIIIKLKQNIKKSEYDCLDGNEKELIKNMVQLCKEKHMQAGHRVMLQKSDDDFFMANVYKKVKNNGTPREKIENVISILIDQFYNSTSVTKKMGIHGFEIWADTTINKKLLFNILSCQAATEGGDQDETEQ